VVVISTAPTVMLRMPPPPEGEDQVKRRWNLEKIPLCRGARHLPLGERIKKKEKGEGEREEEDEDEEGVRGRRKGSN
jgi:hypothetical protein